MPSTSDPKLTLNGLNQLRETCIECAPGLAYVLMSATTAKRTRAPSSKPSRICWVRAESSMPFQQIQVRRMMKTTPRLVTARVLVDADARDPHPPADDPAQARPQGPGNPGEGRPAVRIDGVHRLVGPGDEQHGDERDDDD